MNSFVEINKKLKFQAKNFYERYKEIKATFSKERIEIRNRETILDNDLKLNSNENTKLNTLFEKLTNELDFFKNDFGVKIDSNLPKG